jgi:hypothetical protein
MVVQEDITEIFLELLTVRVAGLLAAEAAVPGDLPLVAVAKAELVEAERETLLLETVADLVPEVLVAFLLEHQD